MFFVIFLIAIPTKGRVAVNIDLNHILLQWHSVGTSEGSDTPQIVRRLFGFSPIFAYCIIYSQILGKPNARPTASEMKVRFKI
jgi:hypothetical protein